MTSMNIDFYNQTETTGSFQNDIMCKVIIDTLLNYSPESKTVVQGKQ